MACCNGKMSVAVILIVAAVCLVGFIGSLVMAIVFAYVPSIVYPVPIVNVVHVNGSVTSFQIRCDVTSDGAYLASLLTQCGTPYFNVEPVCGGQFGYSSTSYFLRTFAFAEMPCPTGYLDQFTTTVDLDRNLVALASCMMILLMIMFFIPIGIVYCIVKTSG